MPGRAPRPARTKVGRVSRWFDDRLGLGRFTRSALDKIFPDHWSFMLGEVALYSFVVLLLTGVFLTFFFDPSTAEVTYQGRYGPLNGVSMSQAYRSTIRLSFDVRAGLVMRQMHHWAALVFIAAIVTHVCRLFFTGAFRRPRELNWMIGVTLLILAVLNGFAGYSLPDDLLSGTGLRIAYSIALAIPVVGTWVAFLFFGGEFPAQEIVRRLFVIHVLLVPAAIVALLSLHLAILWRQKHTQFPGPGRTERNVVGSHLWPTYAAKSVGLFALVFSAVAFLGGLAQINPVWLYGPFRNSAVSTAAQPDWYVGWMEGALRIFPPWEIRAWHHTIANPFFPGLALPGLTFLLLYLWPFLEARVTGDHALHHLLDRPRDRPVRTALGVATLTFYFVLLLSGGQDIIAQKLGVRIFAVTYTFRALVFAGPLVAAVIAWKVCRDLRQGSEVEAAYEARFSRADPSRVLVPAGGDAGLEDRAPASEGPPGREGPPGAVGSSPVRRRLTRWLGVGAGGVVTALVAYWRGRRAGARRL